MDLESYLNRVSDEESFLDFVRALQADKEASSSDEKHKPSSPYGSASGGWNNVTIENFLEGAVAWASDSNFGDSLKPTANPWKKTALFLYAGKSYE